MTKIRDRNRRLRAGLVVVVGGLVLALSSCGSGSPGGDEDKSFTIAFAADPGFQDTPLLATIDELNADGWDIETVAINDQALQTQALASGDVQITASNVTSTLQAIEKGSDLVMLGERSLNDWLVVARSEFSGCSDLADAKMAIHSEASASTFMLRTWLEQECPGIDPKTLIMEGSSNRAAAIVAGRIDVAIVQIADWSTALGANGSDEVKVLGQLNESLSKLIVSAYAAPEAWADDHVDELSQFFKVLLMHNREYGADPGMLTKAVMEHVKGADEGNIKRVIQAYHGNAFLDDGGLTKDRVSYTLRFLTKNGVLTSDLDPAAVMDRRPLEAAMAELD